MSASDDRPLPTRELGEVLEAAMGENVAPERAVAALLELDPSGTAEWLLTAPEAVKATVSPGPLGQALERLLAARPAEVGIPPDRRLDLASDAKVDVEFPQLMTEERIRRLAGTGGFCILATHLGKGFVRDDAVDPGGRDLWTRDRRKLRRRRQRAG